MVQSSNPDWFLSEECPHIERDSSPPEHDLSDFDPTAIICQEVENNIKLLYSISKLAFLDISFIYNSTVLTPTTSDPLAMKLVILAWNVLKHNKI